MSANLHLVLGPPHSGKTARLLERFAAAATSPGAALWLTPTRRAADAVRARLVGLAPALLWPRVLTFEEFAAEVLRANDARARPLSHVQRRLLADDIVDDMTRGGRLSHFAGVADTRGFAEGVFALLSELKRHEIWPSTLARAAYRRGYRGSKVERTRNGLDISAKERQCIRIYSQYQRYLLANDLYDLEGRLWYARDLLRRGRRRPFEALRCVVVDGFADFTRTQREIVEALRETAQEVWLALPDEEGDARAELFATPRGLQARWAWLSQRAPSGLSGERPSGLQHVQEQLFLPLQSVKRGADASGLRLIEAPGLIGEVRLAAREVKTLLQSGTPAEEILVVVRDIVPYADAAREIFAEYGIPIDVEGAEPLARAAAVALLLRAARVPEEGWPFAAVTALLRSTYFRPEWEEARAPADVALRSETLLRLLGEARGRDAFLKAAERWAERVPDGPADEQAEVSRRLRIHRLAVECRPFLNRFFRSWDGIPARAPLADHLAWLRRFADDIGLVRAAAEDRRDATALSRLFDELDAWDRLRRQLRGAAEPLDRGRFLRVLSACAAEAGLARTPRGPGRVRVLSAEAARHLSAEVVVLLGLGERSFPRLAAAEPIFDEAERQSLKASGVPIPCAGDRLPDEMLLFYSLVTRARRLLVLSYPAVDEKGQGLLPSSFLATLLDLFEPGAVPTLRRRMLLEGAIRDTPLSMAELRVRAAAQLARGGRLPVGLPRELAVQLRTTARAADLRFRARDYGPYDGLLRHPAIAAELQERFAGDRVLSPTALETYIACPFRFLLEDVLHLEPLEEPGEDIEGSDRGLVFHRALAWLHRRLKDDGVHGPTAEVDALLLDQLDIEVREHARHSSRAAEALWRIEGLRLRRKAAKYRGHWQDFVAAWSEMRVVPRPSLFEQAFGVEPAEGEAGAPPLVVAVDGVEVRLGGRIDRVDIAESERGTFFWIVDYKTGRSSNYSSASLRTFQRLQLTLYALAVERVLLVGQGARPLGLAYWLVTDTGPKIVLPGDRKHQGWFKSEDEWAKVRAALEGVVTSLVRQIRHGDFPLAPRSDTCTDTCPYAQVCRISQSRGVGKTWDMPLPMV